MALTLGLAGRDFSSSAAMPSVVLEQGFNIKYREQARYHLVLETWFTPSSGSSSQCRALRIIPAGFQVKC